MPILRAWWLAVSFEELLKSTLKPQQIDLFALDSPPMNLLLGMAKSSEFGSREARLSPINGWQVRD